MFQPKFHFIILINFTCRAKDSQKSKLNDCTSQEPNGEMSVTEVLVSDKMVVKPLICKKKQNEVSFYFKLAEQKLVITDNQFLLKHEAKINLS